MARSDVQKLYTTDPLKILNSTDKAVKVQRGDEEPVWLPFSLIIEPEADTLMSGEGEEMELTIYEWLAREKGFL